MTDWVGVGILSALAFCIMLLVLMIVGFAAEAAGIAGAIFAILLMAASVTIGYAFEEGWV